MNSNDNAQMMIYDLSGKQIVAYVLPENSNVTEINNSDLQNGVYFYKIMINGKIKQTEKLVIIK